MSNNSIKRNLNNEKEIITNALLEASKNLIDKIENNVKEIEKLKSDLNGGLSRGEKRESKKREE